MTKTIHYLPNKNTPLTENLPTIDPNLSRFKKFLANPPYFWVLLASLVSLAAHGAFLPMWLSALGIVSIFLQRQKFLPLKTHKVFGKFYRLGQFTIFFGGLVGIFLQYGQLFSLDVSISFLLLCMIGKVWELKARRDAFVMLNMNLFVLASAFLWTQEVLMAIGVAMGVLLVLFGFITLNDSDSTTGEGRLKALSLIGVPALPLLIILFLFFPRIAPLWNMPMASGQATTGVSDSMSPGDFSNLSKSTELAFRVEFDGAIPNRNELYWRAMVFSDFDGTTWRANPIRPLIWRSFDQQPDWAIGLSNNQGATNYRILLQPNHQHWLASLEHSKLSPTRGLSMSDEFTMRSYSPVSQQFNYNLTYLPNGHFAPTLSDHHKTINLALPTNSNKKSQQFAKELMTKANHDPLQFVNLIQDHIRTNNFRYTLSPPLLKNDRIDEFLFGSQAGFCEHYSSSFVFLARSAGIPSRVVVGYQGGELGRDGKSWEVRQMDAHAWAEIWVENHGWVRIDPTAFVSPERIEDGMDSLTNMAGAELFGEGMTGALVYQQFKLLQSLRRYSDQASYYWQKNIVGFDQENQHKTLLMLFNIRTLAQQIGYLIVAFGMVAAAMTLYFWHKRRVSYHVLDMPFIKLSKKLAKTDTTLKMAENEPILSYLNRLSNLVDDNVRTELKTLAQTYRHARFGKHDAKVSFDKALTTIYKEILKAQKK